MRVLHVITSISPEYGGPVSALVGLAEAQKIVGLDVTVMATQVVGEKDSVSERLSMQDVRVRIIGPASGPLLRHPLLSQVVMQEIAIADVVHIHGLWEEIQHQSAHWAWKLKKPYIVRPCGMLEPWSLRQSRLKKQLYLRLRLRNHLNRASALHFTTASERDFVVPLHFHAPVIVEPNGIDLTEFENLPTYGTFRSQYPQLEDCNIVLFLSRLHPKKGLDLLIPAFAQGCQNTMLVIAGPDSGGYRAELERLIVQHNVQDRVIFTGMLEGPQRVAAFADADLFVLPSYQENFGNVVIEALAAGTPVVISDQVGLHVEVSAGKVGEVVTLDVDALAVVLKSWLSDKSRRCAAAQRARPFVKSKYDWLPIASRWKEHYKFLKHDSSKFLELGNKS
jgi:glycosyltransferase involved in cell wall biosynthesis